jgi:membrane-associated phospholipid phosphatase
MPAGPVPLRDRVIHNLALYAAVLGIYFSAGHVARPPFVDVATPLDDALPFVPAFMVGYGLVYVVPLSILWLETTEEGIRRMTRAILLGYLVAAPFFIAMPVQDADPPLRADGAVEGLLALNRVADTTKNAFPSMHVGLATLLSLIGFRRSRAWGLALASAAVVISVSTLLVKQHFVVDIPAGALVGVIAFRQVYGARSADASRRSIS